MANFFKENTKKPIVTKEKKTLILNIERLDVNGCGVAYDKKKPVFVNGSLPNEKVEVRLIEQKNKYARGKLLNINTTSEKRVIAKCRHFSLCGGCDIQHLEYAEQIVFKQNKIIELFSRSGIANNVLEQLPWQSAITSSQWNYRRKARIGVQFDKNAQAIIGFRQKATNQLVAVKSCPVLVEPAENIFPLLQALINQLSIKKAIGHIEILCTDSNDQALSRLTLIVRQIRTINEPDRKLWREFSIDNQCDVYLQEESVSELTSKSASKAEKSNHLSYRVIDDIQINFSYTDFIQINQQVNANMVAQALTWLALEPTDHVLDLFCGLGNFSLPIAKKVANVIGVEGVQSMVHKATENAKFNNIENCNFFQADLNSEWLSTENQSEWTKKNFSKVLLDPARAGAELAVEQIIKLGIPTVLYVSCEPTTLARDSQLLLAQGYKIEKIGLVDMFSQTKHVETMVLFSKL